MTLGAKRRCHGAYFVHNAIEILRVINFFGEQLQKNVHCSNTASSKGGLLHL